MQPNESPQPLNGTQGSNANGLNNPSVPTNEPNTFNGQAQPTTVPNYQQPMPSNQPVYQPPMPGAQPMYQQPIAQQPRPPKPPRQPMDPAKKKKIILISVLAGSILIIGIILAIVIPIILRVDYAEAYRVVKELKPEISEIYNDYSCSRVEDYVDSKYTDNKTYESYVDSCRQIGSNAGALIDKLGSTAGVERNSDIKAQFDSFKKVYDSVMVDAETKSSALDLYLLWHKWAVASGDLSSVDETDADLTSAANILINSGDDKLKAYGEGWLEHRKAAANAYRAYYAASYSDKNKSALLTAMNDTRAAYNNYVSENKPSVNDFPSVESSDTNKLYTEFSKLYSLISDTYAQNYNHDSGDCWEFVGEVVCD